MAVTPGWCFEQEEADDAGACSGHSIVDLPIDSGRARSGRGSLRLQTSRRSTSTEVIASYVVPASSSGGGPDVRGFVRVPTLVSTASAGGAVGAARTLNVVTSSGAPQVSCLEPLQAGRPLSRSFALGACVEVYAPDELCIDDFSESTDVACPT